MKQKNRLTSLIVEVIIYGVLGTVFVTFIIEMEEYFKQLRLKESGLTVNVVRQSLALLPTIYWLGFFSFIGEFAFP